MLLALLAVGLVLRMGAGCEAMAAAPSSPATHGQHCAEMPSKPDKPGKPAKATAANCVLCVALPDAAAPRREAAVFAAADPVPGAPARLAGLANAPVPPPPRAA